MKGSFPGTFFRFPLRRQPSQLSGTLYNKQKVLELFESFQADADTVLLFLKSVQGVSLHVREADGSEKLVFRVTAREPAVPAPERPGAVEALGAALSDYCERVPSGGVTCVTYPVSIVLEDGSAQGARETSWLVCNSVGGRGLSVQLDALADELRFVPVIGIATPLPGPAEEDGAGGAAAGFSGKAFCFLPLPPGEESRTGLPVHVSGFFGLTDNRRSIKWRELDQWRDPAAVWNELLVLSVVPRAYAALILDAIARLRAGCSPGLPLSVAAVYGLWPDAARVKLPWRPALEPLFQELFQHPVLPSLGDHWVPLEQACFSDLDEGLDYAPAVLRFLQRSGKQVVRAPAHLAAAAQLVASSARPLTQVTPAWTRQVLRKAGLGGAGAPERLHLLEFVLSDQAYGELLGLELLPLQSGAFVPFSSSTCDQDVVYIASEEHPR